MLALCAALVHAAKGRDELGYADLLRGEYARSTVWLRSASELAGDDPLELSRIRSVEGAGASDVGRHERAAELLGEGIELARSVDHRRQEAWAMTCLGRGQLICDELGPAEATLQEARDITTAERWTSFVPYPESLLAEVWIRRGDGERAAEALQHSFAVACSVDDACWEAYSVRGLGLLRAADGDLPGSVEMMEDALTRCLRQQDTHRWIRAYVMDALCAVSTTAGHPRAAAWVTDLGSLAARCTMREFSVHAYLYRHDLGDRDALAAARTLALDVENPHLSRLLDAPEPSLLQDLLGAG